MIRVALSILAIVIFSLLSSGCATMTSGTTQNVTFTSEPQGANVSIVSTKQNRFYSTTTPGTVDLPRKFSYNATFEKDGYEPLVTSVQRKAGAATVGSTAGNLLLLGGIVGVFVDSVSGANSNLPKTVHAQLIPVGGDTRLAKVEFPKESQSQLVATTTESTSESSPELADLTTGAEATPETPIITEPPSTVAVEAAVESAPPIAPPVTATVATTPPKSTETPTNPQSAPDNSCYLSFEYIDGGKGGFPIRLVVSGTGIEELLLPGEKSLRKLDAGSRELQVLAPGNSKKKQWNPVMLGLELDRLTLTLVRIETNPKDKQRMITISILSNNELLQRRFIGAK